MSYESLTEIFDFARSSGKELWEVILDADVEERIVSREESIEKMRRTWRAMLSSAEDYEADRRSVSGLVGGDGAKMREYYEKCRSLSGEYIQNVIAVALSVGESNACMKKIVAAPTAGSCGVLPAVLVPLYYSGRVNEDIIVKGLYVAAGIGAIISKRASISGAAGGCQAEIGFASAMAAGMLVYMLGGSVDAVGHASAMALKNLLGLVCDPVAGLVEVPCVKRNVIGSVNAVSAADMALAGIESRVPVDEVIDCMGEVGMCIPRELRETSKGGLASTPFGVAASERMRMEC